MTWITHYVSVWYNFALIWELFETVFRENTVKSDREYYLQGINYATVLFF